VALTIILAALTAMSLALGLWQLVVGLSFPLHRRNRVATFTPAISILKPLKGCDAETSDCLRSWLRQRYEGSFEILFGVGSRADPVCDVLRQLLDAHPDIEARLVICPDRLGLNPKVSQLARLAREARYDMICVSDADVFAPPDFLTNTVQPLSEASLGLVSAPYCFAEGRSLEMKVEAVSVNADFWSQVLQARSLAPMRFALGAALMLRREKLEAIGGFAALSDYLADDYELGQRVAGTGARLDLGTVVVECRSPRLTPGEVWAHQVRWARTIRACRPWAYFFSLLGNAAVWPALWVCLQPGPLTQVSAWSAWAFAPHRFPARTQNDRKEELNPAALPGSRTSSTSESGSAPLPAGK
jgi:ceramide glucosyltransferase